MLAAWGVRYFEIWDWRDKDLGQLVNAIHQNDQRLVNMSGNRKYGMVDPFEQNIFLEEVKEAISFAKKLGCSQLMLLVQSLEADGRARPVPQNLSKIQVFEQIVACGLAAGQIAEQEDFHICIEPLNSVLDHPGYFLDTSELAFSFIKEINHPRVKLLYDVYHMAMMNENVVQDIENHFEWIGYYHFADKPGRHEPGTGSIHFKEILTLLKNLGYEGIVGFEFFPQQNNSARALQRTLELIHEL